MNTDQVGALLVVPPEKAKNFWQPVPANGSVNVAVAPDMVPKEWPFGFGTQTLPPGGYVREHAHDRNEKLLHVIAGRGMAVIGGVEHATRTDELAFWYA